MRSPKWRKFKKGIVDKRGNKCERCGNKVDKLIGDHINTLKLGGEELDEENVQLLCVDCNRKKTSRDLRAISYWNSLDI